ncbi:MAG: hypothetical protein ACJAYU_001327 [Bradymonadia bacterium]|jgi:hypothetical protein
MMDGTNVEASLTFSGTPSLLYPFRVWATDVTQPNFRLGDCGDLEEGTLATA